VPQLLLTIDEIMAREKRDMLFVMFGSPFDRSRSSDRARQRHLAWFAAKGLRCERTAPRGWLEGDARMFAVHFDGLDDPRIAEYSTEFEDVEGKSLVPDDYRMVILSYEEWLKHPPLKPDVEPF
jgi:broad specificity phosphatase PhoE